MLTRPPTGRNGVIMQERPLTHVISSMLRNPLKLIDKSMMRDQSAAAPRPTLHLQKGCHGKIRRPVEEIANDKGFEENDEESVTEEPASHF